MKVDYIPLAQARVHCMTFLNEVLSLQVQKKRISGSFTLLQDYAPWTVVKEIWLIMRTSLQ
jgi:hypothetical protein